MKKKKRKSKKKIIFPKPILNLSLLGCLCFFIGFLLFYISYKNSSRQVINYPLTKPTITIIPTPTIDFSLQNTWKTYISKLYGFSITYPSLGEDNKGNIITCGDNIDLQFNFKTIIFPTVRIDSLYQVTLHPWGSQLIDYLREKDKNVLTSGSVEWIRYQNVDETIIFHNVPGEKAGYFENIFALYKKGNLIYQVEKIENNNPGCQMLFNPRDNQQTNLAKNISSLAQPIINQYLYWNEATSIRFNK